MSLAEDNMGDGEYLIFQARLTEPSGQDRRLEMDSYCIIAKSGGVNYGGLEGVSVDTSEVILDFNEEAAEELSLECRRVVLGVAGEVDVSLLSSGLKRVLRYGNPDRFPRFSSPFGFD
ncbi:hypothetical protein JOC24_002688 [Streptomyces sp. HB132]|nr:hypothetical protein [Streptomyces sp. HB132]